MIPTPPRSSGSRTPTRPSSAWCWPHEMIHALQGQYLPLDSILDARENNDRLRRRRPILEGQATLASLEVLAPGHDVAQNPQFWDMYREQVRRQQSTMPVFRRAPLVLRETLIFPYLQGAEFMHWWESGGRGSMPYGPRCRSRPSRCSTPSATPGATCRCRSPFPESGVGLRGRARRGRDPGDPRQLAGSDEVQTVCRSAGPATATGSYQTGRGPALVWYVVWDDARSSERFTGSAAGSCGYGAGAVPDGARPAYGGGRPATRYVLAPEAWGRWKACRR